MRYAYTNKVNKRVLEFILKELNLNETFEDTNSPMHKCLFSDDLIDIKTGYFNVERLNLLGVMHCRHDDIDDRYQNIWAIINPELKNSIPITKVNDLFQGFKILSIDALSDAFNGKNNDGEILYIDNLMYLSELNRRSKPILNKLNQSLSEEVENRTEISLQEFKSAVPEEVFTPTGFRLYVKLSRV